MKQFADSESKILENYQEIQLSTKTYIDYGQDWEARLLGWFETLEF